MKVYAPNIHLFAFQLYKAPNIKVNSSQEEEKGKEAAAVSQLNKLWKSADKIVNTTLQQDLKLIQKIDVNKEQSNKYCNLIKESEVKDDNYFIPLEGKVYIDSYQQLTIKGFIYPLRFYDSYSLWLNLRRPEGENNAKTEDVDISFFSELNKNNCLTLPKDRLFLGQTLLVTAWLTEYVDKETVNRTASKCLKAVFPESLPPLNHQGELFGSPIFEYGRLTQLTEYQHVLIWLFRDEQTDAKFNQCYHQLLDLFFFRSKVIKAFQDSRVIYEKLDEAYAKIDTEINNIPKINAVTSLTEDELDKFKEKLITLYPLTIKYTGLLRDLEDCHNTIIINSKNYRERLQIIREKTEDNNLSFFNIFSNKTSPYFLQQIHADLGYFNYGSKLLEDAIDSIRGIVEIEQAKRDRSLERTIQIASIGFGGGAIFSSVVTQHIDKRFKFPNPKYPIHPLFSSLFLSILGTLFFVWLGWKLWNKQSNNSTNPTKLSKRNNKY